MFASTTELVLGPRTPNLAGQRFGRITVRDFAGYAKAGSGRCATWKCDCVCGAQATVRSGDLRSGATVSCGCWNREATAERNRSNRSHGLADHPLYQTWKHMVGRCHDSANKSYGQYGGRKDSPVTVHPDWQGDPAAFVVYVEKLPQYGEPGMQLDRIHNDGNYEPGNVRWVTQSENMRNTGRNRLIEFHSQVRCVTEWAELLGLRTDTLRSRLRRDWPVERALTEGVDPGVLTRVFGDQPNAA